MYMLGIIARDVRGRRRQRPTPQQVLIIYEEIMTITILTAALVLSCRSERIDRGGCISSSVCTLDGPRRQGSPHNRLAVDWDTAQRQVFDPRLVVYSG